MVDRPNFYVPSSPLKQAGNLAGGPCLRSRRLGHALGEISVVVWRIPQYLETVLGLCVYLPISPQLCRAFDETYLYPLPGVHIAT